MRYTNDREPVAHAYLNCLAPGETHSVVVRERYYATLQRITSQNPARVSLQVCGDFNAHLGPDKVPPYIGGRGYSRVENSNGELFRRYVLGCQLMVHTREGADSVVNHHTATHGTGHMTDHCSMSARGHFALRAPARLALRFPYRRADVGIDHIPLAWAMQRTELLPSTRRGVDQAERVKQVTWDKRNLAAHRRLSELS